ncbi:MAG: pantetheine-phosphate adenylyltransferase [Verrucomicrobia bacterium]|nr:pantetheine-phosphate adenylyltransferase [Verrucomicrobiota bacterium]
MSHRRAIYPGSFDPVTNGHLDLITRSLGLFDEVIIGVADNEAKNPLFTTGERVDLIRRSVGEQSGLSVEPLNGLLVDFCRRREAFVVIRGLRAVSDFEFEFQMALTNKRLEPKIETLFLTPREDCIFLSSRIVKEVARLEGDVAPFVSAPVLSALKGKFPKE